MPSFKELLDHANAFRKKGQFAEALPLYKELWTKYKEQSNEWVGWGYSLCLSKLKKHYDCLEVCEATYKMNPHFENIYTTYAWALYNTTVNAKVINDIDKFLRAGELITLLSKEGEQFSPYHMTVFKMLEHFEKPFIANQILHWTDKITPELLSMDISSSVDKKGKTKNYPSRYEIYAQLRSEALFRLWKYDDALELSETAIAKLPKENLIDKLSFQRRIAQVKLKKGLYQEAYPVFKHLIVRKRDWYIYKQFADLNIHLDQYGDAFLYGCYAALMLGDYTKRTSLYQTLAQILTHYEKTDEAKLHAEFCAAIWRENGTLEEEKHLEWLKQFDVDIHNLDESKRIYFKLKKLWENKKYQFSQRYVGKVMLILENGQSGFIELPDKNTYYFKFLNIEGQDQETNEKVESETELTNESVETPAFNQGTDQEIPEQAPLAEIGMPVSFYIEFAVNPKKNKPNKVAVHVQIETEEEYNRFCQEFFPDIFFS